MNKYSEKAKERANEIQRLRLTMSDRQWNFWFELLHQLRDQALNK